MKTIIIVVGIAVVAIVAGIIFFPMVTLTLGSMILVVTAIAATGIIIVPTARYGVITRFKKRLKRDVLDEGIHWVIPIVDQVLLYPYELRTDSVEAKTFSQDRLEMFVAGSVQWRPAKKEMIKFVEIPEKTILVGLIDAIQSELGKVSGQKIGDIFIMYRGALELIINCILRLERAPHHYLNPKENGKKKITGYELGKSFDEYLEGLKGLDSDVQKKLKKDNWDISLLVPITDEDKKIQKRDGKILDVIRFYEKNISRIKTMLNLEKLRNETSDVEKIYAIDIEVFKLADVDFNKEVKETLQEQRQAQAKVKANAEYQKQKGEIMDDLTKKGLSPQEANVAADVLMGFSEKRQTISLEGASGALPIINIGKGGK